MRLLASLSLVSVFSFTPLLADGVKAVTTTSTRSSAVAAESVQASSLTLQQALVKPDATKVVHDGKQTTVGELRKRANARAALATSKPQVVKSGAGIKSPFAHGSAQANSIAAMAQQESSAALAQRTTPGSRRRVEPSVGIDTVNGKARGFVFSPGGNVTIDGGQFGETVGQVNIIGQFPGAAASLRVIDWTKDEIHAILPLGIRGVSDHDVAAQVITAAGKAYSLAGGKFLATREEILVTTNILSMVRLRTNWGWQAQMTNEGRVDRYEQGDSINCKSPAVDGLTVTDPGRGFFISGIFMWSGRQDSGDGSAMGDDGSRTFFPGYKTGAWYGNNIDISWGVWRSHQSPYFLLPGFDQCSSNYQIAVYLVGPAGVAPF